MLFALQKPYPALTRATAPRMRLGRNFGVNTAVKFSQV